MHEQKSQSKNQKMNLCLNQVIIVPTWETLFNNYKFLSDCASKLLNQDRVVTKFCFLLYKLRNTIRLG